MRAVITLLVFLTVSFSQVVFMDNMQQAYKKANDENKLVFLLLSRSYCFWCHKMKSKVLKDPIVQNSLKSGYIGVILEKGANIPKGYEVDFYPTSMIINPKNKNILSKLKGYQSKKPLSMILNETYEFYE